MKSWSIFTLSLAAYRLLLGAAFSQNALPGASNSGGTAWAGQHPYAVVDTHIPSWYPTKITDSGLFLISTSRSGGSALWQDGSVTYPPVPNPVDSITDINNNGDYVAGGELYIDGTTSDSFWSTGSPLDGYGYAFALNNSDGVAGGVSFPATSTVSDYYTSLGNTTVSDYYYYNFNAVFSGTNATYPNVPWYEANDTTGYFEATPPPGSLYVAAFYGSAYAINDSGVSLSYRNTIWYQIGDFTTIYLAYWGVYLIGGAPQADGYSPYSLSNAGAVIGFLNGDFVVRQSGTNDITLGPAVGGPWPNNETPRITDYMITLSDTNGGTYQVSAPQVVNGGDLAFSSWTQPVIWSANPYTGSYTSENVNDLIDPNSGWHIDVVGSVNNKGQIAAEGYRAGTGEHALLLTPGITVVSSRNPSPGQPTKTANTVCVGEPVTLSFSGSNYVTAYNWHLPNVIKGFNPSATSSPITYLAASDSNASALTIYYPTVSQTNGSTLTSGTESVSCDLTLISGGTCTVTGIIKLVAPNVLVTATAGAVCVSSTAISSGTLGILIDSYDLHFYFDNPPGLAAAAWPVMPPSGFTSGSGNWLQVITDQINVTTSGSGSQVVLSNTNALDHGFPFASYSNPYVPGELETNDSPHAPAVNPPQTELDRTFSAGMYFMWLSGVPGSIWVPLRVVGWGFQGQMNSSGSGSWSLTGTPPVTPVTIIAPNGEVTWQSTATGGQHVL